MRFLKILFTTILALTLYGCVTNRTIPMQGYTEILGNDFTEYTEQGFLFTPETYLGDYQSVGIITVRVWPDVRSAAGTASTPDGFRRVSTSQAGWFVENIDPAEAIEQMYQQASGMGADALTRFTVDILNTQHGGINISGMQISGFAIRRE